MLPMLGLAFLAAPAQTDAEIHRRAIVIDTHSDATMGLMQGIDLAQPQPLMHEDLPKMKAGGLDAQFFSIWVNPHEVKPAEFHAEALRQIDAVRAMVAKNPRTIALAQTAAEVRERHRSGLLSALLGVEGGHALLPGSEAEQLARLGRFRKLGVRYMTLTWSNTNPIGGSSGDAGEVDGLTDFGRRVIDEMHRLGIVLDVSHVSDPTFWDVIRYAKKPVLATHSSARTLTNSARNMTDAMLKAVKRNGGAVCVAFGTGFLDLEAGKAGRPYWEKLKDLPPPERLAFFRDAARKLPPVPLAKLIDHIDHVARTAGVEHTCLGSDFDGVIALPVGLEDVSKLPVITVELRKRGYSATDLEKILGGNVLRVLEANQTAAAPKPR